jgi:sulfide dehydrogenase [flavocytochrome c] flavoprotein subunit
LRQIPHSQLAPSAKAVVAGFREFNAQQFTYEKIAAEGVTLVKVRATAVEPQARTVSLADRRTLSYDGLVLADALPG